MSNTKEKHFDFPEVRVVEASAGSGKTYALAKRYVQLLLQFSTDDDVSSLSSILAITFTNKAAFEMKERILEFLRAIAFETLGRNEEEEILLPLDISKEEARRRAFLAMDHIIRHYNYFQVQTIDKFVNSFLAGCAFKVGLTSNFKIRTNYVDYLQYSLDQLIEKSSQDKSVQKTFEEFLRNYLYLENRLGWFPKEDILSIIAMLFSQGNSYVGQFRRNELGADEIIKRKNTILEDMKVFSALVEGNLHARFYSSLQAFLVKGIESGYDIDSVPSGFSKDEMPTRKGDKVSPEALKLWNKIRKNLKFLCEEESATLFNPYIKVYDQVMEGFYQLSSKEDVLFLSELNKRARQLFSNDFVTVEELYYRLATRFRHHLIDEFQDTSRLQWQNLSVMPHEALSTGGSLFYVGDKKQAIYGFRGGDVKLFDEVKEEFAPYNIVTESLGNNWRSQKAIVEFNNTIFSQNNLVHFVKLKEEYEKEKKTQKVIFCEDDISEMQNIFVGSAQTFVPTNDKGYVEISYIDVDRKEERDQETCRRLLETINQLKDRFDMSDIAILTRNNKQIEQVTNWLLEAEIPVKSERTSDIRESRIIKELISLLKFLNSPIDNIAFTQFIFGEIFSKVVSLDSNVMQQFVFSLRKKLHKQEDVYVYTEFREQYKDVWDEYLTEFIHNAGLYPIYELVVSIYSKFNLLENFPDEQGFLMHFLELIKKYEEEDLDIELFLKHFENLRGEDLYVNLSTSNAVEILTLHKSKGLEFSIVILPFLGMEIQVGAQNADLRQSYLLKHDEEEIDLLRLKESYYSYSDDLYEIFRDEYLKAFLSELNSVYVSLTRAANEMYAFVPKRVGSRFNILKFLIPEDLYVCGQKEKYKSKKEKKEKLIELECGKYRNWIEFLEDEYKSLDEFVNKAKRLKGRIRHYILSFVGNLEEQVFEEVIAKAKEQVALEFLEEKDFTEYFDNLEKLVKCEDLKEYFFCPGSEVFTEKEVVNKQGVLKRLDRLIVDAKRVTIVDFKSSEDDEASSREQVSEYCEIVKNLYPKHKIQGALVYMDSFKKVQVC